MTSKRTRKPAAKQPEDRKRAPHPALADQEFMKGVREALEAERRGEAGTPLRDLKRKYARR